MKDEFKDDVHKDPAELEREADRARANVEHTLEALERRFSPGQLLDQVLQVVKENGGDFGRNLSIQVRNNPVPVMLTGIGLTWLMAASDRPPRSVGTSTGPSLGSRASSAASSARGAAEHAGETARSAAQGARSAMGSAAESARGALETASEGTRAAMDHVTGSAQSMAHATRTGARSMMEGYDYLRREQPLVLGALAVAAGALIGAMIPSSRAEDEWFGEQSDEAAERLKEEARQKATQAKSAAAEAAEAAKDAAKSAAEPRRTEPQGSRTSGTAGTGTAAGTGVSSGGTTGSGGTSTPRPGGPGTGSTSGSD
jgi:hypothetical protein